MPLFLLMVNIFIRPSTRLPSQPPAAVAAIQQARRDAKTATPTAGDLPRGRPPQENFPADDRGKPLPLPVRCSLTIVPPTSAGRCRPVTKWHCRPRFPWNGKRPRLSGRVERLALCGDSRPKPRRRYRPPKHWCRGLSLEPSKQMAKTATCGHKTGCFSGQYRRFHHRI